MVTAITGGIAEGKSTILKCLSDLGYITLSADEIARQLFPEPETNRRLAEAAGLAYPVTSEQLRNALIAQPNTRRAINRIMHPAVIERLVSSDAEFVEVPLLIETCTQHLFDRVWVVTCGLETQRQRLAERYGSETDADSVLNTQLPTSVKITFDDEVFRTNAPLQTVRRHISVALGRRLE